MPIGRGRAQTSVAVNIMLLRPAAKMNGSAIAVSLRMVYLLLWFTLQVSSQFVFIRQGGLEASELPSKYVE